MSILSNIDIKHELGKNLFIYPIRQDQIKGASINLTASCVAWSLIQKKSVYDEKSDCLRIPAGDTVLIETEESIHVTEKLAGSYHSMVKLVAMGLGHIGTTLDPGWAGPSLIALHNTTSETILLEVGRPFVTVMFYYLSTHSSCFPSGSNRSGRVDVLIDLQVPLDSKQNMWLQKEWRTTPDKLKAKMLESPEFEELKKQSRSYRLFHSSWFEFLMGALLLIVSGLLLYNFRQALGLEVKDILFILGMLLMFVLNQIKRLSPDS